MVSAEQPNQANQPSLPNQISEPSAATDQATDQAADQAAALPGLRADLVKQPAEIAAMFDQTAQRYDLMNDLLSLGQTRVWRRATVAAVAPEAGQWVLDVAAGTGTSSMPYLELGAKVVPCDFSLGMLKVGRERYPELPFVAADATELPFADDSFDAVTISFALRNVQNPKLALEEMRRVTRPGGKIVVCEFSHPTNIVVRRGYLEYLIRALPEVAKRVSSNPSSYEYLAESIADWHSQPQLAALLDEAGWRNIGWRNLTGGIVALHRATA